MPNTSDPPRKWERIPERIGIITLGHGAGNETEHRGCIMTRTAWELGLEWSDAPDCTHPIIRRAVIRLNDRMPEEDLPAAFDALSHVIVGTETMPTTVAVACVAEIRGRWNLEGAQAFAEKVAASADLRGANLGDAYLRGADLRDAYLRGAYLRGANLRDANLGDAYLRGANLRGANLRDAYLGGAYLGGADLRGADLGGADLGGAKANKWTTWHDAFDPAQAGVEVES